MMAATYVAQQWMKCILLFQSQNFQYFYVAVSNIWLWIIQGMYCWVSVALSILLKTKLVFNNINPTEKKLNFLAKRRNIEWRGNARPNMQMVNLQHRTRRMFYEHRSSETRFPSYSLLNIKIHEVSNLRFNAGLERLKMDCLPRWKH